MPPGRYNKATLDKKGRIAICLYPKELELFEEIAPNGLSLSKFFAEIVSRYLETPYKIPTQRPLKGTDKVRNAWLYIRNVEIAQLKALAIQYGEASYVQLVQSFLRYYLSKHLPK